MSYTNINLCLVLSVLRLHTTNKEYKTQNSITEQLICMKLFAHDVKLYSSFHNSSDDLQIVYDELKEMG